MNTGIQVGLSKQAVSEINVAIQNIMKSKSDEYTKREALNCLARACEVKDVSISHVTITDGK